MQYYILVAVVNACIVFSCVRVCNGGYTTTDETTLRNNLLSGYAVHQRPAELVQVPISLNLLTINSLDIREQALSTTAFFTMVWEDPRLIWIGDKTFADIHFIFSSEEYIWRPAIVIENSVSELDVLNNKHMLMRVAMSGSVTWTPGGVYQTNCEADVSYYPLDTQNCSIILTTWAYTSQQVQLNFTAKNTINTQFYKTVMRVPRITREVRPEMMPESESIIVLSDPRVIVPKRRFVNGGIHGYRTWVGEKLRAGASVELENGEWEIINTATSYETFEKDKENFSRLYFTIMLRRRPLYHILNTIFPVMLMASLIVFAFKLPVESGERVGMSLTVLLAYAVYLSLIADNIPQTSISASILSIYLTVILMLSALSVIFTILVLDIYFKDEAKEVPGWAQWLTRSVLVKLALWKGHNCLCCSKKKPAANSVTPLPQVRRVLPVADEKCPTVTKEMTDSSMTDSCMDDLSMVVQGEHVYSWKEIAMILDKCLMFLFIILIVGVTAICVGILIGNY